MNYTSVAYHIKDNVWHIAIDKRCFIIPHNDRVFNKIQQKGWYPAQISKGIITYAKTM